MVIYELCPKDVRDTPWIFYCDDDHGKLIIKPEYRDLMCGECGKINESVALSRGVLARISMVLKEDLIGTGEGWLLASAHFRDIVSENGFHGLSFLPFSENSDCFIVECTCPVETNTLTAGFECKNRCDRCGRYQEKLVGPLLEAMTIPASEKTFFSSCEWNENIKAAYRPLFAREKIASVLKRSQISGIAYLEAL